MWQFLSFYPRMINNSKIDLSWHRSSNLFASHRSPRVILVKCSSYLHIYKYLLLYRVSFKKFRWMSSKMENLISFSTTLSIFACPYSQNSIEWKTIDMIIYLTTQIFQFFTLSTATSSLQHKSFRHKSCIIHNL